MEIRRIKGVIKDYEWGNTDFIPSLIDGYDGTLKAEYWMGTHHLGEAVLEDGTKLGDFLKSSDEILGSGNIEKFGRRLPLLFKILAIETPLSLQCHPTRKQAEDGWKRESEKRKAGLPCNYQDDQPKAEILASLTPTTAMCGFRATSEIRSNLMSVIPETYQKYLSMNAGDNKELFLRLYDLSQDEKDDILKELSSSLDASSVPVWENGYLTEKGIATRCMKKYPGDVGALFPYILNVLRLSEGEAVYLQPDTIHAYSYGNGVELMDASDNVLRGGLTTKLIDLKELERIMEFSSQDVEKVHCHEDKLGRVVYETPTEGFTLMKATTGKYHVEENRLMLGIVTDGSVWYDVGGEQLFLGKGEAFVVPHDVGDYEMSVDGTVYFAVVPE